MLGQVLTEVLLRRAEQEPDAVGYEFVASSGAVSTLSYGQLAGRATAVAVQLRAGVNAGTQGPVLVACPTGLDYLVAVFGGFLAGRPVIPGYPADAGDRLNRARLDGILRDARPDVMLVPFGTELSTAADPALPPALPVPGAEADHTAPTGPVDPEQPVALLQYTSGSTGAPRGVRVRHDSVAANTAGIAECFGIGAESRGLTWLPPYHDMGLVGGLLTPLAAGIPVRILSPEDFLKSPLWWLRQIGESGATMSGGPNFGYDLCLRRLGPRPETNADSHRGADEQLDGIDLSGWRVAFNGGEAVRWHTLRTFADRLAPTGFRAEAFLPCYGLAEATLIVAAGHWDADPRPQPVSCGRPVRGQRVAVVDPERGRPVTDGAEGEIWIGGPHVTDGYYAGPGRVLTPPETFGRLGEERMLRTGDLGRWVGGRAGGELRITGRIKDVLVVRGVNVHAVDVEAAAEEAAGHRVGVTAAFAVEPGGTADRAEVVLVAEVRGQPSDDLPERIRAAVLARTGVSLDRVLLAGPRSVPRTSSGKVRRSACRDAYIAGRFAAPSVGPGPAAPRRAGAGAPAGRPGVVPDALETELTGLICGVVAAVCAVAECAPDDEVTSLGMDSVRAAEAAAVLQDALQVTVSLEVLLLARTPAEAAAALLRRWSRDGVPIAAVADRLLLAQRGVA